jgi:hypothetical protein
MQIEEMRNTMDVRAAVAVKRGESIRGVVTF